MVIEVPGYHLFEKISENEVFTVYRARRNLDQGNVLLKLLSQPSPTPKHLAPLWQEFEILRLLDFPGIEKAYALENHGPWWMIVIEDFGGWPLSDMKCAGGLDPEELLNIALQMIGIVEGIHTRNVIHKNISPASIAYNPLTHQVRLLNFEYASLISKEKVTLQSPYKLAKSLVYFSPEMTGRMNRSVDYRTDYYSLGATLYELLTGTPPFLGKSPIELIHAHLAVLPEPPSARIEPWPASSAVFGIFSAILLKLLAKNPEERYQTPGALRADLNLCLSVLKEPPKTGSLKPVFIPGQADRPVDLNISQVIVGRETETETLLKIFMRTIDAPAELVLVSGEAGVGKTTLVNQLIGPVTECTGYYLYAKFDQFRHMEVYQELVETLEEFCRLILSEPRHLLETWRERIQAEVAPHGQLLTDLCPLLEKVIGTQPPVVPVEEALARTRFHQVVIRFFQAVCRPEHPVVIFLDDLQWMKPDSALLWQSVLSAGSLRNLLVVGVYRDNECGPDHLIHRLVEVVEAAGVHVTRILIQNLESPLIQRLIATALGADPAEVLDLTFLVYRKTKGNPYFSNEYLTSLYRDRLLAFHLAEQKWQWEISEIEEYGAASDVTGIFINKIRKLDKNTQRILQYAALIGRRFDTATLLTMFGKDRAGLLAYSLWRLILAGLIYPLDENYRFLAEKSTGRSGKVSGELLISLAEILEEQIHFEFQHDHVQQAAIDTLNEKQLKEMSLRIGWTLLKKAGQSGQEIDPEMLLAIVGHLNTGSALIDDPTEAVEAAQLNLKASNQARASAAFESASHYLSVAMQLLPANSWQNQYDLTLEVYTASAEVALLNGDLARAEALALAAEANAYGLLEKARLMKIRMDIDMIQTQLDRVFELGINIITMLGFDLELKEPLALNPEQAMQLPEMTDPRALMVSQLDELMVASGYASGDPRLPQVVLFYMDLFSRFGNPPTASYMYVSYAVILQLSRFEQMEQGCRMGRMALELAERVAPPKTLSAVRYVYYGFVHHWWRSARECISPLYESFRPAVESGSVWYSISMQDLAAEVSLYVGTKLEQVRSEQAEALQRVEFLHNAAYTQRLRMWSQVVLNLIGETTRPQEIDGHLFGVAEARNLIDAGQNLQYMFYLYAAQAFLNLLFRNPRKAVEASTAAEALKSTAQNYLIYTLHLFVYSLALLSDEREDGSSAGRLKKVEENLELMRLWAELVPENYLHQLELVEAERARCLGLEEEAAAHYERSIRDARRNGYIHESALAAELAAEFYLALGDPAKAKSHLLTAYTAYLDWGAKAKVEDLVNRYPEWFPPGIGDEKQEDFSPSIEEYASNGIGASIDLNSILKASLELAHETNLEELLRKLMTILVENTGAQNGSLLLCQNDRWFLEVQGSNEPGQAFTLLSVPLEYLSPQVGEPQVPNSIIHYVINLRVNLVLEDASVSRQFRQDAYIRSRQPKSILCAPLLNQGVLYGVIYLENNLVAGAFTADRLEIVQLISSQAAISIEKARLYEDMEAQVKERTRELSEANGRLKAEINERIRVEQELRYNETLLRRVLEVLPVGVWIVDKNSKIISANPEGQRIWGGAKFVEMQQYGEYRAWRIGTGEQIKAEDWAGVLALTARQTTLNEELEIEGFDGTHRTILNSAIPLITDEDGLVGAISVNQDITQRKHYEEELQRAHAQLATLLNISQSIVSTLDLDQLFDISLEHLGKVLPYEVAAILIREGDFLEFRLIRGSPDFQQLVNYSVPIQEPTLVNSLIQAKKPFYVPDLQANQDVLMQIHGIIRLPLEHFSFLRSWLGQPLFAKDDLVGFLVLTHSQPDFYSPQSRIISQAFANQVAIAIQNAQLYKRAHDAAAAEERTRLARELHDSVAQALYGISLFTDAIRMALKTNRLEVVAEHLNELVKLSREAMSDMRLLIFELRPTILEHQGLVAALQNRIDSVESRAGFQARLDLEGTFELSDEQESELYWIALETLNNVIKHAQADQVTIRLRGEVNRFSMTIADNGVGFDVEAAEESGGQGLRNIRERAEKIGATCLVQSSPGEGVIITVEVNA